MSQLPPPMDEFRDLLKRHVREMEDDYPEYYSLEWYFLRYLQRLRRLAGRHPSPRACSSTMQGFIRFYVDSIEQDSELAVRFAEILECHRYALRTERRV